MTGQSRAGSLTACMQTQDVTHWSVIHSTFYYTVLGKSTSSSTDLLQTGILNQTTHEEVLIINVCTDFFFFFNALQKCIWLATCALSTDIMTLDFLFFLTDSFLECSKQEQPGKAWYDERIILSFMVELDSDAFAAEFWNLFVSGSIFRSHHRVDCQHIICILNLI